MHAKLLIEHLMGKRPLSGKIHSRGNSIKTDNEVDGCGLYSTGLGWGPIVGIYPFKAQ
jgi:hypothetical protein